MWSGELRRIAMVDLPGEPGFQAMAMTNGNLIIAHSAANSVDIFNMPRRRLIAQIKNIPGASGIAVNPTGQRAYISSRTTPQVFVVTTNDWSVENTIKTDAPVNAMLYSPDSGKLYLRSNIAQTITAVDPANPESKQVANVAGLPQGMAYDPQQKLLFVALQDQALVLALDSSMQIVKRYPVKGSQPAGLALDPSTDRLYVAVRSAVLQLDVATGAETSRVTAEPGVDRLWLDAGSKTLYAGSGKQVQIIHVAGGQLQSASDSDLELRGESLAFDPETNLVYVPGGREGRSKLLILKQVPGAGGQSMARDQTGPQVATR